MISTEIEYYKPASLKEATELFFALKHENKQPMYYSGGTEIITFRRLNLIHTGAIIDIKGIPECMIFNINEDFLITGAALPLTLLEEKNFFPLLSQVSSGVADRTARNKITVGGNISGQIFYREAVLPFLLADSYAIVAGLSGVKSVPVNEIFNQTLQLEDGQFLVQLMTDRSFLTLPYLSIKKRQQWETGYPLITIAALKKDDQIRFAFSGLCPFPFRSFEVERELNNLLLPLDERIHLAIEHLPGPILNDVEGSSEYRLFVLRNTLMDILLEMEGK
ncbi:FAD binding domain-containing protein [Bacillus sp. FJAT-29790]|uniref:FAD binding domain-containing protein n=1 Tax=Bacillus sp. FJAT-29790 TaxID=1895002 RepID=UPI001C24208D|nr:FAD binding domain-containing protein [Bacillus sp. FJAT-29790]